MCSQGTRRVTLNDDGPLVQLAKSCRSAANWMLGAGRNRSARTAFKIGGMRLALLCLLLAALSWPALAQQDQTPTAPTTAPPPSSQAPAQPSNPAGAQEAPPTEPPPSSAKVAKKKSSKKIKSRRTRRKKHKKALVQKPDNSADSGPRRIVVRRGGTSETGGQLEPGVPESEADHQRRSIEQMLHSTDASLKNITRRNLTPDQQDMARQITSYMEQSRSANEEGDLGRARNLAIKAQQLCDALARQ